MERRIIIEPPRKPEHGLPVNQRPKVLRELERGCVGPLARCREFLNRASEDIKNRRLASGEIRWVAPRAGSKLDEHQVEETTMVSREITVLVNHRQDPALGIANSDASQPEFEQLETVIRYGAQQCLLIGEVVIKSRPANAQRPSDLSHRDSFRSTIFADGEGGFDRSLRQGVNSVKH